MVGGWQKALDHVGNAVDDHHLCIHCPYVTHLFLRDTIALINSFETRNKKNLTYDCTQLTLNNQIESEICISTDKHQTTWNLYFE